MKNRRRTWQSTTCSRYRSSRARWRAALARRSWWPPCRMRGRSAACRVRCSVRRRSRRRWRASATLTERPFLLNFFVQGTPQPERGRSQGRRRIAASRLVQPGLGQPAGSATVVRGFRGAVRNAAATASGGRQFYLRHPGSGAGRTPAWGRDPRDRHRHHGRRSAGLASDRRRCRGRFRRRGGRTPRHVYRAPGRRDPVQPGAVAGGGGGRRTFP